MKEYEKLLNELFQIKTTTIGKLDEMLELFERDTEWYISFEKVKLEDEVVDIFYFKDVNKIGALLKSKKQNNLHLRN